MLSPCPFFLFYTIKKHLVLYTAISFPVFKISDEPPLTIKCHPLSRHLEPPPSVSGSQQGVIEERKKEYCVSHLSLPLTQVHKGPVIKQCSFLTWGFMARPIHFHAPPMLVKGTCVTPRASAFLTSAVTGVVKNQRKPVKSHPTALTVTSAVLISHKATEEAWHTMCLNIQTHKKIHPPVFFQTKAMCLRASLVRLWSVSAENTHIRSPSLSLFSHRRL